MLLPVLNFYLHAFSIVKHSFFGISVVCCRCGGKSNTYDPLLDVSLDIKNVDSLERAFTQFVAADKLDMDNAYKCDK